MKSLQATLRIRMEIYSGKVASNFACNSFRGSSYQYGATIPVRATLHATLHRVAAA